MPDLYGFREGLATALTNTSDNAMYWVGLKKNQQGQIWIKVAATGKSVIFDVMDNGPGVPFQVRERIFDVGFKYQA